MQVRLSVLLSNACREKSNSELMPQIIFLTGRYVVILGMVKLGFRTVHSWHCQQNAKTRTNVWITRFCVFKAPFEIATLLLILISLYVSAISSAQQTTVIWVFFGTRLATTSYLLDLVKFWDMFNGFMEFNWLMYKLC